MMARRIDSTGTARKAPRTPARIVPVADPRWVGVDDLTGVPPFILQEIENFFEIYKTLEPGKGTHTAGWQGRVEAEKAFEDARRRYQEE